LSKNSEFYTPRVAGEYPFPGTLKELLFSIRDLNIRVYQGYTAKLGATFDDRSIDWVSNENGKIILDNRSADQIPARRDVNDGTFNRC
jgi:hypothetical protein